MPIRTFRLLIALLVASALAGFSAVGKTMVYGSHDPGSVVHVDMRMGGWWAPVAYQFPTGFEHIRAVLICFKQDCGPEVGSYTWGSNDYSAPAFYSCASDQKPLLWKGKAFVFQRYTSSGQPYNYFVKCVSSSYIPFGDERDAKAE